MATSIGTDRPRSPCTNYGQSVLPWGERYRWNPDKAAANRRDHGIAFEDVGAAFRDPFAVEWIDDREDYGEERVNMLAMCGGILLHVTYTERGEHIRLISARRAERHEQERYYRENST